MKNFSINIENGTTRAMCFDILKASANLQDVYYNALENKDAKYIFITSLPNLKNWVEDLEKYTPTTNYKANIKNSLLYWAKTSLNNMLANVNVDNKFNTTVLIMKNDKEVETKCELLQIINNQVFFEGKWSNVKKLYAFDKKLKELWETVCITPEDKQYPMKCEILERNNTKYLLVRYMFNENRNSEIIEIIDYKLSD